MFRGLLTFIVLALFLSSCNQQPEADSQVHMDLSSLKNQWSASSTPLAVMLQVSSPILLEPQYKLLDCREDVDCSKISMEVPSHPETLLQLAVLTGIDNEYSALYYGQVSKSITVGDQVSIPIDLTLKSNFSNRALWSGRLSQDGPTYSSGLVEASLVVSEGPAFPLPQFNFYILRGWFQTYHPGQISLAYELNDESLFPNKTAYSVEELKTLTTQYATTQTGSQHFRLEIPSYYQNNISSATITASNGGNIIVSHIGPHKPSSGFCVDGQSAVTASNAYEQWCADSACGQVMSQQPDNTGEITTSIAANSLPVCSTGLYTTSHPIFRENFLMRPRGLSGILFPLRAQVVAGDTVFVDASEVATNSHQISGQFLPGVSKYITKTTLFGLSSVQNGGGDELCHPQILANAHNLGSLAINTTSNSFTGTLSFDKSAYGKLFLCFSNQIDGKYFKQDVEVETTPQQAVLQIASGTSYDFGTYINGGTAVSHSFTLSNVGGQSASALAVSGLTTFTHTGGSFPGGGSCGTTLAAGATCTFSVSYSPAATGDFSETLNISYNDGSGTQNLNLNLASHSVLAGALTLNAGTDPYIFANTTVGNSAQTTISVENSGGYTVSLMADASSLSSDFDYVGGSYPGTGGTCGASLAPGATCVLELSFTPASSGTLNSSLTLSYNDGSAAQTATLNLSGTAFTPASVTISGTDPMSFGNVTIGSSQTLTLTLTNSGGSAASSIAASGFSAPVDFAGGFPGTGGDCTTTLAAGSSCNIVLTFTPTGSASTIQNLQIDYNDGTLTTHSITRQVQGSGLTPASLTMSDDGYDYGDVPNAGVSTHSFTVTNSGETDATSITSLAMSGSFDFNGGTFPGAGGTCAATLAGGSSCTIILDFSPTSAAGLESENLTIDYFDGLTTSQLINTIQGTSVNPALLTITDLNIYTFTSTTSGMTTTHNFTVVNSGGYQASSIIETGLAAPFTFTGGAYPGTGGTCGATIAPSETCLIAIDFSPATIGYYSDTIDISYDNGVNTLNLQHDVDGTGL